MRVTMKGHSGMSPLWVRNASSTGSNFYLAVTWARDARDVAPSDPLALKILVHELGAAAK
jgi:hypothetical protein